MAATRIQIRNAAAAGVAAEALPATEETRARAATSRAEGAAAVDSIARELRNQPFSVNAVLRVDSETLARAVVRGNRSGGAAAFVPQGLGQED